jgi:hypothetical protein
MKVYESLTVTYGGLWEVNYLKNINDYSGMANLLALRENKHNDKL